MFSTFDPDDVTILLKDITGMVEPESTEVREVRIQSGVPYCEMLPIEYEPSEEYMRTYRWALEKHGRNVAEAAASAALGILRSKGPDAVLVSLARAGTTAGILMRRYANEFLKARFKHYTISIIRGVGIDENAMKYILSRHPGSALQFVDGWTGKGAILGELRRAARKMQGVSPTLAVLADPAQIAHIRGTSDDILIPSSCLNATVCGLLSRTFLRRDIIGPNDFHGAAFYSNLLTSDLTEDYLSRIQRHFPYVTPTCRADDESIPGCAAEEVEKVRREFNIKDINRVKPGIGEATRVLLRRMPWKILVHSFKDERNLGHLYALAKEKGVEVEEYPLQSYRACGLVKDAADI